MALRFNKRIKIAPGVKLNVGLKGISATVGVRGASVNIGKKGVYANTGIPGTGVSSRTKISKGSVASVENETPVVTKPATRSDKFFMIVGVVAIVGFVIWLL